MKITKHIFLTIILTCVEQVASAQSSDFGNWFVYFGNQKINKSLNWHNEFQHRNYNLLGDMQQLILRTGIGTNLKPNNHNLLMGYGYIKSQNYLPNSKSKVELEEHRVYQQYLFKNKIPHCFLLHRLRIEERFIQDEFSMRFRYFLNLNIPLNHKKMVPKTVYLSIYDELFFNLTEPAFDRNRIYGAVGYVLSNNVKIEIGAMNQATNTQQRNQLQVVLYNNIPISKQ